MAPPVPRVLALIYATVDAGIDPGPCLLDWPHATFNDGRPAVRVNKIKRKAAAVAWERVHGKPMDGHCLHVCDEPRCWNPYHVGPGTHAENMRQMRERRRSNAGTRNGRAKLTPEQVKAIRADTRSTRATAEAYGVSYSHVSSIRRGVFWKPEAM